MFKRFFSKKKLLREKQELERLTIKEQKNKEDDDKIKNEIKLKIEQALKISIEKNKEVITLDRIAKEIDSVWNPVFGTERGSRLCLAGDVDEIKSVLTAWKERIDWYIEKYQVNSIKVYKNLLPHDYDLYCLDNTEKDKKRTQEDYEWISKKTGVNIREIDHILRETVVFLSEGKWGYYDFNTKINHGARLEFGTLAMQRGYCSGEYELKINQ